MSKQYTITAPNQISQMTFIPERGSIGSSLLMDTPNGPQELLYQHDFFNKKDWHDLPGGWPFLFPICGRLENNGELGAYIYQGKTYHLPMHGFSWSEPWHVLDHTTNSITLQLKANERTRAMYPFEFEVQLHYQITNNQLTCQQTYINHGDNAMPFYAGFHAYLKTPPTEQGKEQVILDYKPTERLVYNERLTDVVGSQPLFELPTPITDPAINEQLTRLGLDKRIQLHYPQGFTLELNALSEDKASEFNYAQLYTIENKPFFCAEHWMNHPNAINNKDGVFWLQPHQKSRHTFNLLTRTKSHT
jgi:galactose mutarotase-like enzyme